MPSRGISAIEAWRPSSGTTRTVTDTFSPSLRVTRAPVWGPETQQADASAGVVEVLDVQLNAVANAVAPPGVATRSTSKYFRLSYCSRCDGENEPRPSNHTGSPTSRPSCQTGSDNGALPAPTASCPRQGVEQDPDTQNGHWEKGGLDCGLFCRGTIERPPEAEKSPFGARSGSFLVLFR